MKKGKTFWINLTFLAHIPVIVAWYGLFFVPTSIWPQRIAFHFWFAVSLVLIQLVWGLLLLAMVGRYDFVCPLTTLLQKLRGYKLTDRRNYTHSFIGELLRHKVPQKVVTLVNRGSIGVVMLLYVFS